MVCWAGRRRRPTRLSVVLLAAREQRRRPERRQALRSSLQRGLRWRWISSSTSSAARGAALSAASPALLLAPYCSGMAGSMQLMRRDELDEELRLCVCNQAAASSCCTLANPSAKQQYMSVGEKL